MSGASEEEKDRGDKAQESEIESEQDRDRLSTVPAICSAVASGSLINTSINSLCPPFFSSHFASHKVEAKKTKLFFFYYFYIMADSAF